MTRLFATSVCSVCLVFRAALKCCVFFSLFHALLCLDCHLVLLHALCLIHALPTCFFLHSLRPLPTVSCVVPYSCLYHFTFSHKHPQFTNFENKKRTLLQHFLHNYLSYCQQILSAKTYLRAFFLALYKFTVPTTCDFMLYILKFYFFYLDFT